ncbi:uncharacterized protein LOC115084720 [Rhinatrema bivittatum]|uniref:uncharacterized protein LOC115084720 n=1 Tax=Rhinatrema bivittatum TaxID=194408 RepID=UPI001126BEE1|nr:uncharacterized protein LOC115084720 [Rhinatrema bivittatum]
MTSLFPVVCILLCVCQLTIEFPIERAPFQGQTNLWVRGIHELVKTLPPHITDCIICTPRPKAISHIPAITLPVPLHHILGFKDSKEHNITLDPLAGQTWTQYLGSTAHPPLTADLPRNGYLCLSNVTSLNPIPCNYTYYTYNTTWIIHKGTVLSRTPITELMLKCNCTIISLSMTVSPLCLTCVLKLSEIVNVATETQYTRIFNSTYTVCAPEFDSPFIPCAILGRFNSPFVYGPYDSNNYTVIQNFTNLYVGHYWLCDGIVFLKLPTCYDFCVLVTFNYFSRVIPLLHPTHNRSRRNVPLAVPEDQAIQLSLDYINSTYPLTKTRLDALSYTSWLPFAQPAVAAELGMAIRRLQSVLHVVTHELGIALRALQQTVDELTIVSTYNRHGLDYMLAAQGGLCTVLNSSECCTVVVNRFYIVRNAMQKIQDLAKLQVSDFKGGLSISWWDSFSSWFSSLAIHLRGLVGFAIGFLALCLLLCFCLPCICSCLQHLRPKMLSAKIMVSQNNYVPTLYAEPRVLETESLM